MSIKKVYICLGGNQGDTLDFFNRARQSLAAQIGPLLASSKLYKTKPLTLPSVDAATNSSLADIQDYYNAACAFSTELSPAEVLKICLAVEATLGRIRNPLNRYESRAIDIDIALFSDLQVETTDLQIPHPRLHERDFMLQPLIDLDDDLELRSNDPSTKIVTLLEQVPERFIDTVVKPVW